MPQESRVTPFQQVLQASGLVAPEVVREVLGRLGPDADDTHLANRLVAEGVLNDWQVAQLREGRTKFNLGQYAIVDTIARGGMGHVFKGEHQMLGRTEAVKVLPRSKSNPKTIASFCREIRAQAALNHPNLVRVSYADRDGDTYYLVTEFVPGVDLRRLVRRSGPLPVGAAAWVILQAALGLDYAHRSGVIHRDVKPGNLLVTPEGEVKLADLGLAYFLSDTSTVERVGGKQIAGTCDYLAPESIENPTRMLPISDIYALGCTLYYAVAGKVPYPGGNAVDKLRRCLDEPPLPVESLRSDLPGEFVRVVQQMMHKDLDQRTPSAQAVAELMEAWVTEDACRLVSQQVQTYAKLKRSGAWATTYESEGDGELEETLEHSNSADLPTELFADPQATPAASTQPTRAAGRTRRTTPLDVAVWTIAAGAVVASITLLAMALGG